MKNHRRLERYGLKIDIEKKLKIRVIKMQLHRTIQPPAHITFKDEHILQDDPLGDFRDTEIRAMNRAQREEEWLWVMEHD